MSNTVDTDIPSIDEMEQELAVCERLIGRLRRHQARVLATLDRLQVHAGDGARTMAEWTAARLDVTHDTARRLMDASVALPQHPDSDRGLGEGTITFDRALATARLAVSGASRELLDASIGLDLSGLARLSARHRRITTAQERAVHRDRFLTLQPALDESSWRLRGRLGGLDGKIVENAVLRRAEELPGAAGGSRTGPARRADALVSVAQDSLGSADVGRSGGPTVTVFVDAAAAFDTRGEAGAEIAAGPRIGPLALERLLCEGTVGVIALDRLRPVATSSSARSIPPAVRRTVLFRDGGCVIEGCRSRYRLQPHHVTLRSDGGSHDPDNLATLCWYHHHVAVHGSGFRLDPSSPPGRRRLLPPVRGPDPPG